MGCGDQPMLMDSTRHLYKLAVRLKLNMVMLILKCGCVRMVQPRMESGVLTGTTEPQGDKGGGGASDGLFPLHVAI